MDDTAGSTVSVDLALVPGSGGVVWSTSPMGFHANLVVLEPGQSIAAHRNDAVDVLLVVLAGAGAAEVAEERVELAPAVAVQIPRGARRVITAGPDGVRYLTVHQQPRPLTIGKRSSDDG